MAKPLLNVHYVRKPGCEYPMQLKVAMDDGTIQTYNLVTEKPTPDPNFLEAMAALDRMFECLDIGYKAEKPVQRKYRRNR